MKIGIVGKFPPIEGGVSTSTYWTAKELVRRGHDVHVITNALEVQPGFRQIIAESDLAELKKSNGEGVLHVHHSSPLQTHSYVPWANPFQSKLLGLTLRVAARARLDLLVGWYWEPYGLSAFCAAQQLGVPFVVRHAGSDLDRLWHHPDLAWAYRAMLDAALCVLTGSTLTADLLQARGVPRSKIWQVSGSRLPSAYHEGGANGISIVEHSRVGREWVASATDGRLPEELVRNINRGAPDDGVPTIGVYGKIGATKGSHNLVRALMRIRKSGIRFNFLVIALGWPETLTKFVMRILDCEELASSTWILPPLPPWKVPSFLHKCDIVCDLENNFPIKFHGPRIPREILASGACFICSREIWSKLYFRENLIDGKNIVIVPDPSIEKDAECIIGSVLRNPRNARTIGMHGFYLSRFLEAELPETDGMAASLEKAGALLR